MRCACAAALLLCAALAHAHAHAHGYKRAEMSASPFVLSSRYGRSSPRMSPRNDRFFLTGRYGKRSGAGPQLGALALELVTDRDRVRGGLASDRDAHSWRPRCSCPPYAGAGARAAYYKRTPELVGSSWAARGQLVGSSLEGR